MTNHEIHRLMSIRETLEKVMDTIYDTNIKHYDVLVPIIQNDQSNYVIKTNWEDKWQFDGWAASYDVSIEKMKLQDGIYKNNDEVLKTTVEDCLQSIQKDDDNMILDIDVGTGSLSGKLLNHKLNVVGVDQSRNMLSVVKQKFPQLKVRLGDFMNLPFEANCFDVICSTYAFHHLNDSEKEVALVEMMRVLKPGGKLFLVI